MKKQVLNSVVWREGDMYVSQCLNVDVASCGDTKAEALESLHEALELYFEEPVGLEVSEVNQPEVHEMSVTYA